LNDLSIFQPKVQTEVENGGNNVPMSNAEAKTGNDKVRTVIVISGITNWQLPWPPLGSKSEKRSKRRQSGESGTERTFTEL